MSAGCCGPKHAPARSYDRWHHFFFADLRTSLTTLCGVFLIAAAFFGVGKIGGRDVYEGLAIVSVLCGAVFSVKEAAESLLEKSLDVNLLMIIAAAGAIIIGDYFEAAGLLFLFSLSGTLEAFAMTRTKSAIESLISLRPDTAILIENGVERSVPVSELKTGQIVKAVPFSAIPIDGIILSGSSSLDQSAMTGESQPAAVTVGSKVLAGTQNLDGLLEIQVESPVGASTLDKIVGLVQEAQENKASGERISSWFGEKYTMLVLASFAVSLGIRLLLAKEVWGDALYNSLTLLVGMSPCAIVISTPAATLSALAWSAKNGMLVRGGEFIEKAGTIQSVAFDKTGTLTAGRPRLVEICVCEKPGPGNEPDSEDSCWMGKGRFSPLAAEVIAHAAAAEKYISHPLAMAAIRAAEDAGIKIPETKDASVIPGRGIRGLVDGATVFVGSRKLLEENGVEVPSHLEHRIGQMQEDGLTASFVSVDGHVSVLGFKDTLRPGAAEVMKELRSLGVSQLTMLSGDTVQTVQAIANEAGLTSAKGGLLPHEKAEAVKEMAENQSVMMVGDGVNDAPSLALATVGTAMGGLGSDVALNAADVVLMRDDLAMIPTLVRLGRRTNSVIRWNLIFAAGVVAVLTAGSLAGHMPLLLAVVGHEGSTVIVILSGLRLLRGPLIPQGLGRKQASEAASA